MSPGEILAIITMIGVFFFLATGFPVAFALSGTALFFGLLGYAFGAFSLQFFGLAANRIYAVMNNEILIAVPLFVGISTCLTAINSAVTACKARKTVPKDPWPISAPFMYFKLSQLVFSRCCISSSSDSSPSSAIKRERRELRLSLPHSVPAILLAVSSK